MQLIHLGMLSDCPKSKNRVLENHAFLSHFVVAVEKVSTETQVLSQDCAQAQVKAKSSDCTVGKESKLVYLSQSPTEAEAMRVTQKLFLFPAEICEVFG